MTDSKNMGEIEEKHEQSPEEKVNFEKKSEAEDSKEEQIDKLEEKPQAEEQKPIVEEDDKLKIFEKNDLIGGYSLAVRDNWGFKILRRHITQHEKELFEKEFGEKLIKDDEFFTWWCKVNDIDDSMLNDENEQALYGNYGLDF